MAWTTITGANTGSIPQGVSASASIFDAPFPDYTILMAAGIGDNATNISSALDNPSFNPVILQAKYDEGLTAGGGGGGDPRPTSGLVFPRGS